MIELNDLCVIERPIKSMMESSFITTKFSELNAFTKAKSFFKEAFDAGLLCPRVKVSEKQVTLDFGIDHKYVKFSVSNEVILFSYGTLGIPPKSGIINDNRQLKTLSEFIFPKSKVTF